MGTEWDVESRMEIERKGNRERMGIVWNREQRMEKEKNRMGYSIEDQNRMGIGKE